MNPIGMHYGFWSHNWDEIAYIPLMEKLAWLGFDIWWPPPSGAITTTPGCGS